MTDRSPAPPRAAAPPAGRTVLLLLWLLAVSCSVTGAYAIAAPHSFYRHVVGVHLLGPYNEHLLSDVGGFYLGFGVTFTWAARTLSSQLVRATCAGFALTQTAHFIWHALNLQPFTFAQGAVQTIGLGVFLALPLAVLYLSWSGGTLLRARRRSRDRMGAA